VSVFIVIIITILSSVARTTVEFPQIDVVKIVDCHEYHESIALVERNPTVASSKNRFIFHRDGHFFALQMVNFSSLHDDQWPAEVCHQFHSIELVIALRMVISWSNLDFISKFLTVGK
jgi:hypothetical protein